MQQEDLQEDEEEADPVTCLLCFFTHRGHMDTEGGWQEKKCGSGVKYRDYHTLQDKQTLS